MPLREPISFSPFAVTAMTTSSGHSAPSSSGSAKLSLPSAARARVHLDEPAEDRARRRPRPLPRDDAALARRQREAESSFRRTHERRESRSRRREPRAGRKVVAARDANTRCRRRPCAAASRGRRRSSQVLVAAHAVQRQLVAGGAGRELHRRLREQRVERDRDRADGRHVQTRVGLAPIFDEREVGAGAGSRRAAERCRLEVVIRLEPIDGRRDGEARIAPSIVELLLRFATREIHVLRRHPHAIERHARLAFRELRQGLGSHRERIDRPMRQANRTRSAADVLWRRAPRSAAA